MTLLTKMTAKVSLWLILDGQIILMSELITGPKRLPQQGRRQTANVSAGMYAVQTDRPIPGQISRQPFAVPKLGDVVMKTKAKYRTTHALSPPA
jgi:hypothetical protein